MTSNSLRLDSGDEATWRSAREIHVNTALGGGALGCAGSGGVEVEGRGFGEEVLKSPGELQQSDMSTQSKQQHRR